MSKALTVALTHSYCLTFAEHCIPATPGELFHIANILTWPGVLFRNTASFKYVNTMNGSVECVPSSGLDC